MQSSSGLAMASGKSACKLMSHGVISKAPESHYDMFAYQVDMTGAPLGEKRSPSQVKLG